MEQIGAKRRLVSRDSSQHSLNSNQLLLVDSATNTECQKPMQLNAWTQTTFDDLIPKSEYNSTLIDELQNRINKLENLFRANSLNEPKIIPSTSSRIVNGNGENTDIIESETIKQSSLRSARQTKYKIITSKGVEYIEPIEVVYAEEDGIYNMDHDLNTSNDSQRLEICLPKEDEDEQQTEQQQEQQPQQNVQEARILYQEPLAEDQNQKYYNIHNALVTTAASQPPILSPMQQPSQSVAISQSSPIETQPIIKREPSCTRKSYLGSTTNLNEITSSQEQEQPTRSSHDVTNIVVSIGPHNTRIPAHVYESMDWSSPTTATRKLLITIFDRETLSTHTMTGKPSPAFRGRDMPKKHQLDPQIVSDIIFVVSRKCGVPEKDVRNAITTKCADENKMSKQREKKRRSLVEYNKENLKTITTTETY